jgi:hypothetical protein
MAQLGDCTVTDNCWRKLQPLLAPCLCEVVIGPWGPRGGGVIASGKAVLLMPLSGAGDVCVCVCVCMCVFVCVCVCARAHVIQACMHARTHARMHVSKCTCM